MKRWRTTIDPGPFGVSRHVRTLYWRYINTFEGFEDHIRALVNINEATFSRCGVFCSLDDALPLLQVASNLVELTINNTNATPEVLSSFFAALPRLRRFRALGLVIELDGAPTVPLDNIPFFKGANNLTLLLEDHSPGKLDWLPSTARFANLGIGTSCVHHDLDLVNSWIASSRETLERLDIHWEFEFDDDFLPEHAFGSPDLSTCRRLKTLQLPLLLDEPRLTANFISSITSSGISTIVLHLELIDDEEVGPQDWETLEENLCRLAKQFKAAHGGRKMSVEINLNQWETEVLLAQFRNGGLMPNLGEEAKVVMAVEGEASMASDISDVLEQMGKSYEKAEKMKKEEKLEASKLLEEVVKLITQAKTVDEQASMASDISDTLDQILKAYTHGADLPSVSDLPGTSDADHHPSSPSASSNDVLPIPDEFGDFFDFSLFDTFSKATTPDFDPTPPTNADPEPAAGGSAHTPIKVDIGFGDGGSDIRNLGFWSEIDGGEGVLYQQDNWKWSGQMSTMNPASTAATP